MTEHTGKQRRKLRGLAHHLDPIVQVGKEGVTDSVLAAVRKALDDHELIKVRVLESAPEGRDEAGAAIAAKTDAHVAGAVGRIVMLYRRHPTEPKLDV